MQYEELANKLLPKIKGIAYKLNGHYRSFNHDDLCQEALMHLWVNLRKGVLVGKTDSYILQGCYFHLRNYIRKVNERFDDLSCDVLTIEEKGVSIADILILSSKSEACSDLNDKLLVEDIQNNCFSTKEKSIIQFFKDGLTTREIGKKLKVSHVSIVKIMHKIKIKCRRYQDKI